MARYDSDDGEELLRPKRPKGPGCGKLALILGVCVCLLGGVLLLCLIGLVLPGRKPGDAPVAGTSDKASGRDRPSGPEVPPPVPPSPDTPTSAPPPSRPPAPKTDTPNAPKTPLKPVEPEPVVAKANGVTLTVLSLKRKDRLGDWVPDKGFSIYAAEVEVASSSAADLKYGPRVFKLKDKQGRESAATLRTFDGALTSGILKRGERVRGVVAFSAREAQGLTLILSSAGWKEPLVAKLTD